MKRVWLLVVLVLGLLLAAGWASDFVTFQGERIVYTAACEGGQWQEGRCTGRLTAGKRYRYLASREKGEVVVQIVGSSAPAGTLYDCAVQDGRNWTCPAAQAAVRSWTLQMVKGKPVTPADVGSRPDRRVSKWRWHLLAAEGT